MLQKKIPANLAGIILSGQWRLSQSVDFSSPDKSGNVRACFEKVETGFSIKKHAPDKSSQ
jgi:hypothetical protein